MQQTVVRRPSLADLHLSVGKRTRLYRLLYGAGPANGTLLLLPYDHGIEHGPIDFLGNPESADPARIFALAVEGRFSGVVTHVSLARRYYPEQAGKVPLVVKINGRTGLPYDVDPISTLTSSVEEAASLGADAIGYTLYVGSAAQDRDISQLADVRREAERLGMPLIVWSYPRGWIRSLRCFCGHRTPRQASRDSCPNSHSTPISLPKAREHWPGSAATVQAPSW